VNLVESGQYVRTTDYDVVPVKATRDKAESIVIKKDRSPKRTQQRTSTEPRLTRSQQIELIAGNPITGVLNDKQKRHLQWRKKVRGELSPDTNAPHFYLHAVHEDALLTYQFKVKTVSLNWYVHIYIHPTWEHFQKHHTIRSDRILFGCVQCRQKDGLLAEIHLLAKGLSELTVIHESVHAGVYLSRLIGNQEAKVLAAPYVSHKENIMICRDEIQCRTVELLSKQIVMFLHTLNIPCVPLRIADIVN